MVPLDIKTGVKLDKQQLDSLLVEISTLFINLPVDQINSKIEDAQRCICEYLDLERSTLWQFQEQEPEILFLTNFYQNIKGQPPPDRMNANDFFPWVLQQMMSGETVSISRLDDLPEEAARDREAFKLYGTKAGVYVPLSVGQGPVFGVLAFAAMEKERDWSEKILKGFSLLSQVFANALARLKSEMSLRENEVNLILATDAAETGLWNMNINSGLILVSKKTRDLFHFDSEEKVTEESFLKVVHPEDRDWVSDTMQQAILSGENFQGEYKIVLPNGKIRWIAIRGQRHNEPGEGLDRLLGVSSDITERKKSEHELEERLRFEEMLAEITAHFVNLPADLFDSEVEEALHRICEFLDLDLVALWQWSKTLPDQLEPTHIYSVLENLQPSELSQEHFPWCKQQMVSKRLVAFSSLDELPAEAAFDRESCKLFGIKSNLTFPLSVGPDRPIGVLGLNAMRSERDWSVSFVERLQLVAQTFANAIERKQTDRQLRENIDEIEGLKNRLKRENIYLQEEVKLLTGHSEILGQSTAIKNVLAQAEQVAETDSTVLLLGETGTGKELLARAIHKMSLRKDRPLVTINCAALPAALIENELFGREKGAYTGAMTKMVGRFELADGSTLFLDEIGELPIDLQSKLLRVLEEGQIERLGSTKSLSIDVRIIAATNKDLDREVLDGKFRLDLFYRLNVFPMLIPPLRDRAEDIPILVRAFVRDFQKRLRKQIEIIPHKTIQALKSYHWPGNIRELRNMIERSMILSKDCTLLVQLPNKVSSKTEPDDNFDDRMRREILTVLKKTDWRIAGPDGAAEILGLKRSTLYSKMKKLGIHRTSP